MIKYDLNCNLNSFKKEIKDFYKGLEYSVVAYIDH